MRSAQSAPRVALLTDELPIATRIQNNLEAMGYTVVPMRKLGSDAATPALDPSVSVILVDLDVKGAVEALSSEGALAPPGGASVIFLADDNQQIARVKTEAVGCGWVERPFHPIELFFEIQLALERRGQTPRKNVENVTASRAASA